MWDSNTIREPTDEEIEQLLADCFLAPIGAQEPPMLDRAPLPSIVSTTPIDKSDSWFRRAVVPADRLAERSKNHWLQGIRRCRQVYT